MLIWGQTPTGDAAAAVLMPWKLVAVRGERGVPVPVSLFNLAEDPDEQHDRLREEALRPVVDALLDSVRDFLARHERSSVGAPVGDGLSGLDEDDLDWLREMGYLR
jgi:hypothetical protein